MVAVRDNLEEIIIGVWSDDIIFERKINGKSVGKTFSANSCRPPYVVFAYLEGFETKIIIKIVTKIVIIKSDIFILLFFETNVL